ncbi:hypothetical protein [Sporosarcina highlanderae]|uniref:Group-specific protein n=1 Tax=Sporosarcina highlanderae TaxID=3035916 RepID=A0ABT8JPD3_9BACL|nr:hypothetical protein [Sporosarcina highlanderae]MDN4606436.1 hypothetical protein [Sporosarcina highlanderae]
MKLLRDILIFFIFGALIGVQQIVNSNSVEPEIVEYKTIPFEVKDGWVCIPEGEHELTVGVQAKNTKKMYFYLTPTGTNTASQKVLIGESEGRKGIFTVNHIFKENESILYHFSVDYENQKYKETDHLFNIVRCE